jgi:hypothetical protein
MELAMPLPVEALAQEILGLPPAVRASLLDRVIASLDVDRVRDAAWDALAAQRDAESTAGTRQGASAAGRPVAGCALRRDEDLLHHRR